MASIYSVPPSPYYDISQQLGGSMWGMPSNNWMAPSGTWMAPPTVPEMSPFTSYCWPSALPEYERSMNYFEREFERMKQQQYVHNRPYSTELCSFPSRPTSLLEHFSFMNPVRMDIHGNRCLNLCFDLRTFKPEEIKVTFDTIARCIHVEAQHEVKDIKEHYVRRHYNRKFFIPKDLEIEPTKMEVKSYFTPEGLLYVEAPLPKVTHEELAAMGVPVKHPHGTHFGFMPVTTYQVPVKNA